MQLTKYIPAPKEKVFDAFINPQKLEQWYFSEGFRVKDIIPNERLVVEGAPDKNIQGFISFRDHGSGSDVVIRQDGFRSNEDELKCEQSWADGLSNLTSILV